MFAIKRLAISTTAPETLGKMEGASYFVCTNQKGLFLTHHCNIVASRVLTKLPPFSPKCPLWARTLMCVPLQSIGHE